MGSFSKPGGAYVTEPFVVSQVQDAARWVGQEAEESFNDEALQRLEFDAASVANLRPFEFDSPLEVAFWVWWLALTKVDFFAHGLELIPHVPVVANGERYVIDFVLYRRSHRFYQVSDFMRSHWPNIGIELDGHAFHEKTLDQVNRRNQRDRALQQEGWHIFHFSFSEFTGDPSGKVVEVMEFVREMEARLWTLERQQKQNEGSPSTPPTGEADGPLQTT